MILKKGRTSFRYKLQRMHFQRIEDLIMKSSPDIAKGAVKRDETRIAYNLELVGSKCRYRTSNG